MDNDTHPSSDMRQQIEDILSHLDEREAWNSISHPTGEQEQPEAAPTEYIDVYIVTHEQEPETPTIESTLAPETTDATETAEIQEEPLEPMTARPGQKARLRVHPVPLLGVLCLVVAVAVTVVYILPELMADATVTIIPTARQITTTTTIHVVTRGPAESTRNEIAGRALPALTMSEARTVPTTGVAHQDAQAAHGSITFYNASTVPAYMPAGELLTGASGVQVVIEEGVSIPAAVYPTFGQATVTAHATVAGPQGNLPGRDIYGPCCRLNVSAVSSPFAGGIAARTYQTVSQQDITGVENTLKTSLVQSAQAAMYTQVHPDETVITPIPCQETVTPDHVVGEEAAQVHVTVNETCIGAAYTTQAYQSLVSQLVAQQALKELGDGYTQVGDIQATINTTTPKEQGTIDLTVTGAGTWVYQFSKVQLDGLKAAIAGQESTQARQTVLHTPGVESVSLSLKQGERLPRDSSRLHLVVLQMPAA